MRSQRPARRLRRRWHQPLSGPIGVGPNPASAAPEDNTEKPLKEVVEDLYLGAVSRLPSSDELNTALAYLDKEQDKRQATEDLLWTLLNSKEFMFNH